MDGRSRAGSAPSSPKHTPKHTSGVDDAASQKKREMSW